MRNVSIQDMAKDLNLSRNTISKALSNSATVSEGTKNKIIKRALELGYKKISPELALNLEKIATVTEIKNVAVISRKETADFWNRILMGISEELEKNNYNLLFRCISEEDENNLVLPQSLTSNSVDGIILLSIFQDEYLDRLKECEVPLIFLDSPVGGYDKDYGDVLMVEGDNSVYKLTKYLVEKGCKSIGFIGDISYCQSIYARWSGYSRALKENNIKYNENICFTKDSKKFYDEIILNKVLEQIKSFPDGIICANDDIAINVMKFLKGKNIKVPEKVLVTGFDDKRDAVVIDPPLTTVHVSNELLGRKLVQELKWRIENQDMPVEIVIVKTEVIIRKSS